jgi:hypothetical protein
MAKREKGRPGEGSPIPNAFVHYDATESNSKLARFQEATAALASLALEQSVALRAIIHAVTGGSLATAPELAVLE